MKRILIVIALAVTAPTLFPAQGKAGGDERALRQKVVEDATGRSGLFGPGARVGFDPQPDPPATR
jgi:hypothetical protein